jgi:hypothetical protein
MREYNNLIDSTLHIDANMQFDLQFAHADANHDNHLDLAELKNLVQQHWEIALYPRGVGQPFSPGPVGTGFQPPTSTSPSFKANLEAYWLRSGNLANPTSTPSMMRGNGMAPPSMPVDSTEESRQTLLKLQQRRNAADSP